jgi:hypothetical protein
MKKALANTKVTVKLRKSEYHNEWYLIIESYPVFKPGNTKPSRVIEAIFSGGYCTTCLSHNN